MCLRNDKGNLEEVQSVGVIDTSGYFEGTLPTLLYPLVFPMSVWLALFVPGLGILFV